MSYWYSREIDKAKDNLYGTTILIVIISSVPDYHVLESAIRRVTRCTRDRLVIILHCVGFANSETPRVNWHEIQRFYVWAYVESAALAQDMGKVLLDTQIVPRPPQAPSAKGSTVDAELAKKADVLYMFEGDKEAFPWWIANTAKTVYMPEPTSWGPSRLRLPPGIEKVKPSFPVVALGGTFDHLHVGHKVLLSMGAWVATKKVIVGVADEELLANKSNRDLIEPLADRIEHVRSFLALVRAGLEYEVVPIKDIYGPTAEVEDIQAIVVSKDTESGATAINKKRKELGFPALETLTINIISPKDIAVDSETPIIVEKAKISSTFIRQWILDRQQGVPLEPETEYTLD